MLGFFDDSVTWIVFDTVAEEFVIGERGVRKPPREGVITGVLGTTKNKWINLKKIKNKLTPSNFNGRKWTNKISGDNDWALTSQLYG